MKIRRKSIAWVLGLFLTTSLFLMSCSDDDSPSESDIFIGTYEGSVSYSNGEDVISDENGSVQVVKVGDNYNFIFSNDIPDITGVEFESDGETLINIGSTETELIRVTANTLQIFYQVDGNDVWTANCTR